MLTERDVTAYGWSGLNIGISLSDETVSITWLLDSDWVAALGTCFRICTCPYMRITIVDRYRAIGRCNRCGDPHHWVFQRLAWAGQRQSALNAQPQQVSVGFEIAEVIVTIQQQQYSSVLCVKVPVDIKESCVGLIPAVV
ncbi:hypothetical protein [Mycobacterium uberis]|uniref:hypothetical protein n=1 Tax=Mycobacterium uberis TaxID=2162698 RepID=UPI001FB274E1|nr:hypothetical protein [Mycobacterium uberis]